MSTKLVPNRNLFEVENARNLTPEEVVKTFVTTQAFWRLLSPKNHILLGSRGSGKTAVAKMISHNHLSRLERPAARDIIKRKQFIGIYVPTRIEWVGGLKNKPWQTDSEKEQFFQWRLNVASCLAFINTARSCLTTYIKDKGESARLECDLSSELSGSWNDKGKVFKSLNQLEKYLEDTEYFKLQQLARIHSVGHLKENEELIGNVFDIELFGPLRRAITIAERIFNFPDNTSWLLCLDEAEFLEESHQRIINSFMRAYSGNLFFKITTMPYRHLTTETTTNVPLSPGNDFEYIYMDRDPVFLEKMPKDQSRYGTKFARTLYKRRAKASGLYFSNVSIDELLGPSVLIDSKTETWKTDSKIMNLLNKYASPETINRANKLQNSTKFSSQIGRKMHGALLLRDQVENLKGASKLNIYSGANLVMRCGDTNPRRLIRIFNSMLLSIRWPKPDHHYKPKHVTIRKVIQNDALLTFSSQTLSSVRGEPEFGPQLYDFLTMIGQYMHYCFYSMPLTTDQISSIRIGAQIFDSEWKMIQNAVELGLLYPNINPSNPDELPIKSGTFHLSYSLAPHFRLLPRRGKALTISTITRNINKIRKAQKVGDTDSPRQLRIYDNL